MNSLISTILKIPQGTINCVAKIPETSVVWPKVLRTMKVDFA